MRGHALAHHHSHCARRSRSCAVLPAVQPTTPQGTSIQRQIPSTYETMVIILENNVFSELPLLLAVPRAAQLLGISRAAAYRLVASGELPVRRLGGRVYGVAAGLRELAS